MQLIFPIVYLLAVLTLIWAAPYLAGFLRRINWGWAVLRDELAVVAARRNFHRGGKQ